MEAVSDFSLLEWHIAMGCDEVIGDQPINWFVRSAEKLKAAKTRQSAIPTSGFSEQQSQSKTPLPRAKQPQSPTSAAQPVASSNDSVGDARKTAAACKTIQELTAALADFTACPLSRTATNLCFFDGNPSSKILLIGEAPGRDEDIQGKPFVGRSGQLLDKMLSHIGLSRSAEDVKSSVLISNMVFWRPPGNRKPTEAEMLMCIPFVNRLIELVKPDIIMCLGATPTQRLTGETRGITRLRGRWFKHKSGNREIDLLATLHPAYLLRQPIQKSMAWRDLVNFKKKMQELS